MSDAPVYWDPYDIVLDDDPYPMWARMRAEAPVYHNETYDFYALSRYADVEFASRQSLLFSSSHGIALEQLSPQPYPAQMMIFRDPPDHTSLRALVSRAFTPRRVAGVEDHIRALCAELLDPMIGGAGFDYVEDFAAQLPSKVISELVGVPEEDRERTRRIVDTVFHIEEGVGMANEVSIGASLELAAYLLDLVEERTRHPQDDLISALIDAEMTEPDGTKRRPTPTECVEFAFLLYTAGTETVAKLLGNAAILLARHPDQRAALVADPARIPAAIEETLRYEPPSPVQGRWLTDEVELHGVRIPKDSKVLLLTGSSGRDEAVFDDADRYDVFRAHRQHLTFGYGPHFCIGASLARIESRVALEETLKRFPTWDIVESGVRRIHTSTVRGHTNVPVTLG